jgi:hypothetical protein
MALRLNYNLSDLIKLSVTRGVTDLDSTCGNRAARDDEIEEEDDDGDGNDGDNGEEEE